MPLLGDGPCFATPVFRRPDSNSLWIQDTDRFDRVIRFLKISEEYDAEVQCSEKNVKLTAGDHACTSFWDGAELIIAQTRDEAVGRLKNIRHQISSRKYLAEAIDEFIAAPRSSELDEQFKGLHPTALYEWMIKSKQRWADIIAPLDADDERRFSSGYWCVGFQISPFEVSSLRELARVMERETPKHSGWPPFTYLHNERAPQPRGETIEAWLGKGTEATHADFWRVSKSGFAYLLRPMQEDRPDYRYSKGTSFDWVLPIWRTSEILIYLASLASHFSDESAKFSYSITYEGVEGRFLNSHTPAKYFLDQYGPATTDTLSSYISRPVKHISDDLHGLLIQLLSPIYEQFAFAELPLELVRNVVDEVLENKLR